MGAAPPLVRRLASKTITSASAGFMFSSRVVALALLPDVVVSLEEEASPVWFGGAEAAGLGPGGPPENLLPLLVNLLFTSLEIPEGPPPGPFTTPDSVTPFSLPPGTLPALFCCCCCCCCCCSTSSITIWLPPPVMSGLEGGAVGGLPIAPLCMSLDAPGGGAWGGMEDVVVVVVVVEEDGGIEPAAAAAEWGVMDSRLIPPPGMREAVVEDTGTRRGGDMREEVRGSEEGCCCC